MVGLENLRVDTAGDSPSAETAVQSEETTIVAANATTEARGGWQRSRVAVSESPVPTQDQPQAVVDSVFSVEGRGDVEPNTPVEVGRRTDGLYKGLLAYTAVEGTPFVGITVVDTSVEEANIARRPGRILDGVVAAKPVEGTPFVGLTVVDTSVEEANIAQRPGRILGGVVAHKPVEGTPFWGIVKTGVTLPDDVANITRRPGRILDGVVAAKPVEGTPFVGLTVVDASVEEANIARRPGRILDGVVATKPVEGTPFVGLTVVDTSVEEANIAQRPGRILGGIVAHKPVEGTPFWGIVKTGVTLPLPGNDVTLDEPADDVANIGRRTDKFLGGLVATRPAEGTPFWAIVHVDAATAKAAVDIALTLDDQSPDVITATPVN